MRTINMNRNLETILILFSRDKYFSSSENIYTLQDQNTYNLLYSNSVYLIRNTVLLYCKKYAKNLQL